MLLAKLHLVSHWFVFIITSCYQETVWLVDWDVICCLFFLALLRVEIRSHLNWHFYSFVLTNITKRSMSTCETDLLYCTFLSLILHFPSPTPSFSLVYMQHCNTILVPPATRKKLRRLEMISHANIHSLAHTPTHIYTSHKHKCCASNKNEW